MSGGDTMFDKIWADHVVTSHDDGTALLYIDRHFVHDGARNAFERLRALDRPIRCPAQTFFFADHLVPTVGQSRGVSGIENSDAREMAQVQIEFSARHGIRLFGLGDAAQGIVHVVGPEQGLVQPGLIVVCGDSHTATLGALGALGFGIGSSEVTHVLATQALWQVKPKQARIWLRGTPPAGVTSKDLMLALIARIGADGATGHIIEFAGEALAALSVEARMTLCNMAIEAGSRSGLIGPDQVTFDYLAGKRFSPQGEQWERAVDTWRSLTTDADARFDLEVELPTDRSSPMVTWGTSPEDAVAIDGLVPDPAGQADPSRRARQERALEYMDFEPGTPVASIPVGRVFIGSCTNSRIEDLRQAAEIVRGRRAVVPALVVPGSWPIRRQAETEGLADIFREAGFEWREPGCSMCLGMNGDMLEPGERCASTSNRNFEGRQGPGGRTHLMSPPMAAAAAITGRLTDVRELWR